MNSSNVRANDGVLSALPRGTSVFGLSLVTPHKPLSYTILIPYLVRPWWTNVFPCAVWKRWYALRCSVPLRNKSHPFLHFFWTSKFDARRVLYFVCSTNTRTCEIIYWKKNKEIPTCLTSKIYRPTLARSLFQYSHAVEPIPFVPCAHETRAIKKIHMWYEQPRCERRTALCHRTCMSDTFTSVVGDGSCAWTRVRVASQSSSHVCPHM